MKKLVSVVAAAVLLADPCALPVLAQEVGETARVTAREHFERGRARQDAHDYAGAIEEYQSGYLLVPLPEFLFNIAQCNRLMGNRREAIAYYKRYLEAAPNGRGVAAARLHVEKLQRELDADDQVPLPPKLDPQPGAEVDKTIAAPPAAPTPKRLAKRVVQEQRPSSPAGRITGISLMGTGALSTAVAAYLGLRAHQLADEVSITSDEDWSPEHRRKWDRGELLGNWSVGLFIAGGVLVVAGVTTYWLSPSPRDQVRVVPMVGAGETGLGVQGTF